MRGAIGDRQLNEATQLRIGVVALIENEQRIRQAVRGIRELLRGESQS